jgi:hypothetical protein
MRQYIDVVQDVQGNALVGVSILVQNYVGGGNASIYSDNGLTPIANSTVTSGSDGSFSFFAADGDYNLVFSKNSTVYKTQSPVSIFDGTPQITYTDTGTANTYAISNTTLEKALRTGLRVSVNIANANTGASTFQYNGLAAKSLYFPGGSALSGGVLVAGGIYSFEYDGTGWQVKGASATAANQGETAAELAAGVTPTNYQYSPWRGEDIRRFGAVAGSDISSILTSMNAIGSAIYIPPGTWPINSNTTVTVPLNVDYGAILTPANGVALTINASVTAGLYQIFSTASGGTIVGKIKAPFYPVEWWGATGNGRGSSTGAITNGTTTLTDTNGTFTAADVGKTIILVPPQYTTYSPLITTIVGYTSATSVTLNAQLAWASGAFTGVDYYYGTDDTVAIKAANATVGQMAKYSGEGSAFYGAWAYAIAFNAGTVYLMTQQLVIGTPGVTASQAIGVGGNATIAFGISSTTTDCIQMGLATGDVGSSFCALENLFLDGCFSGQDIIYLAGFQNPRLRNVFAQNANRDVLSLRPPSGSFIQQGDFQNLYLGPAGRNCFYAGPASGSFVNECDFLNVVYQYPAVRLPLYSGTTGTAIFIDNTGGGMDSWNITNYKASVGWANQTGYSPLGAFFYVAAGATPFNSVGITLTTGYCEQGQTAYPIGSTTAPFTCATGATATIRVRGFYSSYWGSGVNHADHDGASAFTVTASGSKVLATLGQPYYAGIVEFVARITDGTNIDYLRFQAIGTGNGTAHIDTIGTKATIGTAPTYTLTTSSVSNILQVNFNNTGSVSLTITYSARVIDAGACVAFSY